MDVDLTDATGIALAALLACIGYLFRVRTDHKKSARRVLYLLLEIRFSLLAALFDPEEATDQYIEYFMSRCRAEGVNMDAVSMPAEMRAKIMSHFQESVAAAKTDLEARLLGDYEESLLELSTVHPTLAYRLLGRHKLEKLVAMGRTYGDQVSSAATDALSEQWTRNLLLAVLSKTKRDAFREMKATIDNDLLDLAKRCGFWEYRRCRKLIRQSSLQVNAEALAEMNPMISQLLHMIIEAAKQEKSRIATDASSA